MNQPEKNITAIPAQYYVTESDHHDEIDLFELTISILEQWKLIIIITAIGTLIAVGYTSTLAKQFENYTNIRAPLAIDLKIISLNSYGVDTNNLFMRFYDNLKSPEVFKDFIQQSGFITEFYPSLSTKEEIYLASLGLAASLNVDFINDNDEVTNGKKSRILQVKLNSINEDVAVITINNYLLTVEQEIFDNIRERGQYAISLRTQEIEEEIAKLRKLAKQSRLNSITSLKETVKIAKTLGVEKPLASFLSNHSKSNSLNLYMSESQLHKRYMLGSDYLNAEINRMIDRGKEITADDAFIPKIPMLLLELSILNKKTFNFKGAKLYIIDKLAAVGDSPAKPNKKLIVVIGILLSGFFALFVALIVSTVQKRKLLEVKNENL